MCPLNIHALEIDLPKKSTRRTFRDTTNFTKRHYFYPQKASKCFNSSKIKMAPKIDFSKTKQLIRWLFIVPFKKLVTDFFKVYFQPPTCKTLRPPLLLFLKLIWTVWKSAITLRLVAIWIIVLKNMLSIYADSNEEKS